MLIATFRYQNTCRYIIIKTIIIMIKGPDNPTSQLLPTSNKRKAKTAWGKQEREKRW